MKYKPIPDNSKHPPFMDEEYKKLGEFHKAYKYRNEKGEWIYCTVCYILDGKRNYHKFIYNDDTSEWEREINVKNNVLYNLDKIIDNPEKDIVLVDEETSIPILEATNQDDFVFTTFTGTPADIESTNFQPLTGRKVYYFSGSWLVSKTVRKYIKLKLPYIIIVEPLVERQGWNITDDLPGLECESEFIKKWITNLQETVEESKEIRKNETVENMEYPFQLLGYNQGYMYFLPGGTGQIFKVKQGTLNKNHLSSMAPLDFWRNGQFGYESRGMKRIAWEDAIDCVINNCYSMGPFDSQKIRGRGAWENEKGELIIHTGKYIIEKSKKIEVKNFKINGYVYETLSEFKLSIKNEMISTEDLKLIIDCFKHLAIETKLQLNLFIGWCVLAPFCGALKWRPHLWITGGAGTGKSTIIEMIVWQMLGDFMICPDGNSSAAGISQYKTNDSLPVVYDEAEPSTQSQENIRAILDITRTSSNGGSRKKTMKGTPDQTGRIYVNNSMFCLGSVNILLTQKSDSRRFSIINMKKNNTIKWEELSPMLIKAFSDENCEKIRSYVYHNWQTIKQNITNFSNAAGTYLEEMGLGDQIGTLLAGATSLFDMKIYSYEEAYQICKNYLKDFDADNEQISDEMECLLKIMTAKIRYINNADRTEDTTLRNLINLAAGKDENMVPDTRAKRELYKYGINYNDKKNKIYIACNYEWIKNLLKGTSWEHNYHKILMRLEIVEKTTEVVGFGTYHHGRALSIDAECIFRLSDDKVFTEAGF